MEELLKAVVSRPSKGDKYLFCVSVMMILVTEGVTEEYYKYSKNLDTHLDISNGL